MELQIRIGMNPKLYVRDPEQSELGRNIIRSGIEMISEIGFEAFTFKKLAQRIGTTEASIYRYFENKHRLLVYIITWFWGWMEYYILFRTNNIKDPKSKIEIIIRLLAFETDETLKFEHIDMKKLHRIVISESDKIFLTGHVNEDNEDRLFKPYKDLCSQIAGVFREYNPNYPFPRSLASTLVETAHFQYFFKKNLPSLTDFSYEKDEKIIFFLEHFVFASLNQKERKS